MLVVDDEASLRHAVARYFRSLGHEVDAVGTGRDALDARRSLEYDAMMLDLRLPDMPGTRCSRSCGDVARAGARRVHHRRYAERVGPPGPLEASGHPTVRKPFLLDELAAVVLAEASRLTAIFRA